MNFSGCEGREAEEAIPSVFIGLGSFDWVLNGFNQLKSLRGLMKKILTKQISIRINN